MSNARTPRDLVALHNDTVFTIYSTVSIDGKAYHFEAPTTLDTARSYLQRAGVWQEEGVADGRRVDGSGWAYLAPHRRTGTPARLVVGGAAKYTIVSRAIKTGDVIQAYHLEYDSLEEVELVCSRMMADRDHYGLGHVAYSVELA